MIIQNHQRSKIHKLRKTKGGQVETHGEIEEELIQHFKGIMIKDQEDMTQDIDHITRIISRVVTQEHNEILIRTIDL